MTPDVAILALHRSGSALLASLLASHPMLDYVGASKLGDGGRARWAPSAPGLTTFCVVRPGRLRGLLSTGPAPARCIWLRRDVVACARSRAALDSSVAAGFGKARWDRAEAVETADYCDPPAPLVARMSAESDTARSIVEDHYSEGFEIWYEHLTAGDDVVIVDNSITRALLCWLGVSVRPLVTRYRRMRS